MKPSSSAHRLEHLLRQRQFGAARLPMRRFDIGEEQATARRRPCVRATIPATRNRLSTSASVNRPRRVAERSQPGQHVGLLVGDPELARWAEPEWGHAERRGVGVEPIGAQPGALHRLGSGPQRPGDDEDVAARQRIEPFTPACRRHLFDREALLDEPVEQLQSAGRVRRRTGRTHRQSSKSSAVGTDPIVRCDAPRAGMATCGTVQPRTMGLFRKKTANPAGRRPPTPSPPSPPQNHRRPRPHADVNPRAARTRRAPSRARRAAGAPRRVRSRQGRARSDRRHAQPAAHRQRSGTAAAAPPVTASAARAGRVGHARRSMQRPTPRSSGSRAHRRRLDQRIDRLDSTASHRSRPNSPIS